MFVGRVDFESKAKAHRAIARRWDKIGDVLKAAGTAKDNFAEARAVAKRAKAEYRQKKAEAKTAVEGVKADEAKLLGRRTWKIPVLPLLAFIGVGIATGFAFANWTALNDFAWAPYVLGLLCGVVAGLVVSAIYRAIVQLFKRSS